jgi:hypothetical protein
LRHGPHAVTLRASLRAAMALDGLPGGIAVVWDGIARQNLTTLHAVIRGAATDRAEADRLLAHAATQPLAQFAHSAQAACLALMSGFLTTDAQGEAPPSDQAPPRPLGEHLADLYRYGTGWLGWPPSEVWNASIAELETAFMAHVDRVVRMTPGAAPSKPDHDQAEHRAANLAAGLDPDFDRAGLQRLKRKQ